MSNKIHPHPLSFSDKKKSFPDPSILIEKLELEKELKSRSLNIKLNNSLTGGVISQVYEADLDGQRVIVKHTEDRSHSLFSPPFTPYDFLIDKEGHNLDANILMRLKNSDIKVPRILHHFPDIFTTVMSDLRMEKYELLANQLLSKKLNNKSAKNIGKSLALVTKHMKNWGVFETIESAEEQIHQRGMELRLFYINKQEEYLDLEKHYCKKEGQIIWTDGHPKNIFIDSEGNVAFIDFGRVHLGDKEFVLPSFLAHFTIYSLDGYVEKNEAMEYINSLINAYNEIEQVDEELLCKYLGMELLHRSSGRWIDGVNTRDKKLKNIEFGMKIFDLKIQTKTQLLELLNESL